ncbi:MAG: BON domain-containing protein [Burkholderiales bacterium]|nr:BON domain-containing protein [Opitutaceae bacterium]
MKTSPKLLVLLPLALAGLCAASLATGCASTATSSSTGEYVDDSAITVKVKSAFVKDPIVKALDVSVETYKGVVQLSGFVGTPEEKRQAEAVAANVKGVTGVKNGLIVK